MRPLAADLQGMTRTPADPVERRQPDDLRYDAEGRRLSLGSCARAIAPDGGNRAVLETFVEVVAACRGTRPNHLVDVRDSDMDALCEALDLDATDLRQLLERVLGLSPALSTRLLSNLRQRRLLVRMASAAAGVAVVGGLATGLAAERVTALLRKRSVRMTGGLLVILFGIWTLPGPHQHWLMGH